MTFRPAPEKQPRIISKFFIGCPEHGAYYHEVVGGLWACDYGCDPIAKSDILVGRDERIGEARDETGHPAIQILVLDVEDDA